MVRDWRKNVDPGLREYLESQIKGTFNYKKAYENADNKGNAQLWIAVAGLSKQLFNIHMKINYIESLIKDVNKKNDDTNKGSKKEKTQSIEAPIVAEAVEDLMGVEQNLSFEKETSGKEKTKKKTVAKKLVKKEVKKAAKPVVKKPVVKKKPSKVKKLKKSLKRF